jgi:hypothetical protein
MVVGPCVIGPAIAHADLFGFDFCGDEDKSDLHHPRPGSEVSAQSTRTSSFAAAAAPTAKVGSVPENVEAPESAVSGAAAGAPENVDVVENVGVAEAAGGGGVPRANITGRAGNLPRVSSAPVTRSIVIRGVPQAAAPALVPPTLRQAPAAAPLAAAAPVSPEPEGEPAPAAPPAPSPQAPQAKQPIASNNPGIARISDSYRAGYAEHLRAATVSDLFGEALPGVAGIAGFTLVGAFAGYRQARALQRALLAPVPTSILL